VLHNYDWLVVSACLNLEWPVYHILLDHWISEFSSDESLGIKDRIMGVFGNLILGSISNESFSLGKGNIRGSRSVSLIIGYNLNSIILPNSNTRVGSA
jgi:hypothetical protein